MVNRATTPCTTCSGIGRVWMPGASYSSVCPNCDGACRVPTRTGAPFFTPAFLGVLTGRGLDAPADPAPAAEHS